jgi:hypothetical protein
MNALSNELGAFMMRIVNGRFAYHIMKRGDCLSTFMMWIAKRDVGVFSAIRIWNEKCKCRPIGNKESKNQPIGDKDKHFLECGMSYFECALSFTIHIHDRSGKFEWIWF